jgi:hypothetical protein
MLKAIGSIIPTAIKGAHPAVVLEVIVDFHPLALLKENEHFGAVQHWPENITTALEISEVRKLV